MSTDDSDDPLSQTIASTSTLQLAALPTESLLHSTVEQKFDRLTRIATKLLNVPVAAITVFHHDAEWFKCVVGWDIESLPLDKSLGHLAAIAAEPTIIPDTAADARTQGHALIAKAPFYRFFAGVPLFERHGTIVGTLSVMDTSPRSSAEIDRESILDLGAMAQDEILADQIDSAQAALTQKLGAARRDALIDPLTRVWNRRGGQSAMKTTFFVADEENKHVTICLIDVDKFKTINDTYGHDVGDIVLRKIAEVLVGNLREHDIVCRLGGDEFLLVLLDADDELAAVAIERVRKSLADEPLRTRQGDVRLTVSAGYSVRKPHAKITAEEMILLADQALIASKSAGRNKVLAASSVR